MINVDNHNGICDFAGNGADLLAELTKVMRIMYQQGLLTDKNLETVLSLVTSTDSEIINRANGIRNKDSFTKLFGDLLDE